VKNYLGGGNALFYLFIRSFSSHSNNCIRAGYSARSIEKANTGNAGAQLDLGITNEFGKGATQDYKKAVE
jgi:TPR repeat protein